MASKGYVVRGKDADGIDVYADEDEDADVQCNPDEGTMLVGDERFSALDAAAGLRAEMIRLGCTDVAIYQVHDDGHEGCLPSYEEALGELVRLREVLGCKAEEETHVVAERLLTEIERCVDALKGAIGPTPADPLAALEAAERRLLEAGGWLRETADAYGSERWSHPTWKGGKEGRSMALSIERRRLAAEGGA